jgi:hypothetical protein
LNPEHNKAIKWTDFSSFFCGLTLRYHKKINYKAAIYGGVMQAMKGVSREK